MTTHIVMLWWLVPASPVLLSFLLCWKIKATDLALYCHTLILRTDSLCVQKAKRGFQKRWVSVPTTALAYLHFCLYDGNHIHFNLSLKFESACWYAFNCGLCNLCRWGSLSVCDLRKPPNPSAKNPSIAKFTATSAPKMANRFSPTPPHFASAQFFFKSISFVHTTKQIN